MTKKICIRQTYRLNILRWWAMQWYSITWQNSRSRNRTTGGSHYGTNGEMHSGSHRGKAPLHVRSTSAFIQVSLEMKSSNFRLLFQRKNVSTYSTNRKSVLERSLGGEEYIKPCPNQEPKYQHHLVSPNKSAIDHAIQRQTRDKSHRPYCQCRKPMGPTPGFTLSGSTDQQHQASPCSTLAGRNKFERSRPCYLKKKYVSNYKSSLKCDRTSTSNKWLKICHIKHAWSVQANNSLIKIYIKKMNNDLYFQI